MIAYRASVLHFFDDPDTSGEASWEYIEDGLLIIENGKVLQLGPTETLQSSLEEHTDIVAWCWDVHRVRERAQR